MKKTTYLSFILLTALLSVSASVWEGAASVSLNGELPETGYYAATRSFPRNTVVDITNLETGMSIRVIVASGLESPGLLAILSKEAASAIGLPIRSVGRIRMTMPSDPVAFSRFPEEISSSGDPDFDPLAVIAAAGDSGFDVKEAAEAIRQDSARAADTVAPEPPASNPAAADIVDLPASHTPPQAGENTAPGNDPVPVPSALYNYSPEPVPPETNDIARPVLPDTAPPASGIPQAEPPPVPPEAAALSQPVLPGTASPVPSLPFAEPALVPAGPRPPVSPFPSPLPAEIPPVEKPAASPAVRTEPVLQPMIPPIAGRASRPSARAEPVLEPMIPPVAERASKPPARAEAAPLPPVPSAKAVFSVPVISSLEKGKYYLQLAAYTLPELVENELARIGSVYPRAIQETGSPEKPLYRILIGPVNLGESGALLQRFKTSGYRDAFIRKEG
jgi:hypothetical protein